MRKRGVMIVLLLILMTGVLSATVSADEMYTGNLSVRYGQTEARSMLAMVNEFRTGGDAWYWDKDDTTKIYAEGLEPLEYDYELEKIAMQRAAEIAVSFDHYRPNGQLCFDLFPGGYYAMGENIAAGQRTASAAYTSWREDDRPYSGQGHRRNMLSSSFNRIGIGHAVVNNYHYWVQSLGNSGSSSTETSPNDSVTLVTIEYQGASFTAELSGLESVYSGEAGTSMDLPELTLLLKSDDTWPTGSVAFSGDPVWSTADSGIAAVSDGKLLFQAAGTTTLTASQNGASVSAQVNVTKPAVPSNITSCSLDFNGKLYLNTFIIPSDEVLAAPSSYYVSVTFNGVTSNYPLSNLNFDEQGRAVVKQVMLAGMMRDPMTIRLFSSSGELQPLTYKDTTDVTEGFVYTAVDYLKGRQESSSNPEMRELALAAELYGIAVQNYFNYHTELLTQEDISRMQTAAAAISIPASCNETVSGKLPAGISKRTKTVLFEEDNALRQFFYMKKADLGKYTFTQNGKTVTPTFKASSSGDSYYLEQPNIASGLLSTEYTFSVSDGTDTYSIRCSALGYAYSRQENSTKPEMVALAKLLYRYSRAAEAYFN